MCCMQSQLNFGGGWADVALVPQLSVLCHQCQVNLGEGEPDIGVVLEPFVSAVIARLTTKEQRKEAADKRWAMRGLAQAAASNPVNP